MRQVHSILLSNSVVNVYSDSYKESNKFVSDRLILEGEIDATNIPSFEQYFSKPTNVFTSFGVKPFSKAGHRVFKGSARLMLKR